MNAAQWWIFLPACIGMNFFPGPNNLLALVHGTRTNARQATLAGLARLPAMVVMLVLLAVGLEALLACERSSFSLVTGDRCGLSLMDGLAITDDRYHHDNDSEGEAHTLENGAI
jgi:hypothetical protein